MVCGHGKIELLERKFAKSKFAFTNSRINITNRKYCLIVSGEKNSPDSTKKFISIRSDNIVTVEGFGFIKDVIIDQHFVRRKRLNRLISLVIENPQLLGIGIDESTAIWVKPDRTFEVIGLNSVLVFDALKANGITNDTRYNFAAANILLHLLICGQSYDLNTRLVIK